MQNRYYFEHLIFRTPQLISKESTYLSFLCTVQYYWRSNDTAICFAEVVKDGVLEVWYNEYSLKFWGVRISKLFYCVCLYVGHFNFLDLWAWKGKALFMQHSYTSVKIQLIFIFGPLQKYMIQILTEADS